MKNGRIRNVLAAIFFVSAFAGAIFACIGGFIFSGWYIFYRGIDGIEVAFKQQDYFTLAKHLVPMFFSKFLIILAGFGGLFTGWIPGYIGLLWLEKDDDNIWK